MVKLKISKEQRKAIRDAQKMIEEVMKKDGNEAETRRRVERIFEDVTGYDVLKHLSRERAVKGAGETEHVDFTIHTEPGTDTQPTIMVELKRVGVDLSKKHLKQVTSYAIDAGCNWILLTNGREWKIYHVEFGQPPKVEILDSWNLLEDETSKLIEKFEIISYRSVRGYGLDKIWGRVKVLAPKSLLAAICTEDTFRSIKRNLRKNTGILVNNEEIHMGISKLLNEAGGIAMSKVKVAKTPQPAMRRRVNKEEVSPEGDKNEIGQEVTNET